MRYLISLVSVVCLGSAAFAAPVSLRQTPTPEDALAALQSRVDRQEAQILKLIQVVNAQQEMLHRLNVRLVSDAEPAAAATPAQAPDRLEAVEKKADAAAANLNGFKFSGDFRFRLDAQLRSGNAVASPLQNVRSRYRFRLNADKELDPKFRMHLQLSTAPWQNAITNDQDMAGLVAKHGFTIAEAFVDYRPSSQFTIRGGRMENAFADNSRFLWDDDVRFNGFQQSYSIPFKQGAVKNLEFRAAQYFLTNPNVALLAPGSPFVAAGYKPGGKVRAANLFHSGAILRATTGGSWAHQLTADFQIYRNADQIQLASTAAGAPAVLYNAIGVTLSGPLTGTGNATTSAGGAEYAAGHFQIPRLAYRITKDVKAGNRTMPFYLDLQAARNAGTDADRDAFMVTANLGAVRNRGDVRFLYQFARKEANSLISQFTDDDLGTGTGVNIRVNAVRFDLGLNRFLQWQNLLFIQNQIRSNDPARQFFVPLQSGARTTFRYLGQLAFTF